ncbi:MAG: tetratricopeptide repeat protein [Bacteroidetes bacterium]|nr:tetratricopeptide repeat protein [Bacteroidota bacterium]
MKNTLIIASIALTGAMKAQTLQDAITKTLNERYESAAADFRSLIAKEPGKGENYFYFGENYFANDELDSANIFYQKGVDANATNPLNYVGLGKVLWYKGKTADAKTQFYKAATLGANKNGEVMRKTAEAYTNATTKNLDEAIQLLNNAIKLEPKNPDNYILLGDAMFQKNPSDGTSPIKNYQKATELNPKSTIGVLREGKLYQYSRNYQLALEKYKSALQIDATFAPAYREIAEMYLLAGQNNKSIENWKKYLELNNSNYARYRYMSALYNNKQYAEAVTEAEGLKKNGFTNLYVERIAGYSYYELGDKTDKEAYNKGLAAINEFFKLAGPNFKYIATDYKYKGLLMAKTGQDSLGVLEIEKAINMDAANCDLWVDVAGVWMKSKKYAKAIAAFDKKAACPKGLSGQNYFDLGRAYYFGPKDFVKADTCFSKLIQASNTFPAGYFWRGKANIQLDPKNEKWSAKPFFEKALELLKPEEKTSGAYKNNVIEAYEYLGYYYVVQKDNAKATEYFTMLKEVDPTNKKATDFFKKPAGGK